MPARRTDTFLATGAAVVFSLATAAAAGAIPHADNQAPEVLVQQQTSGHVHVVAQAHVAHHQAAPVSAPSTRPASHSRVTHHHSAPTTTTQTIGTSSPTTPSATPTPAHHSAPKHHKPAATPTHSSTPKPKPTPTTPAKAARTTPSASEVQGAIQGLKQYVHSFLSPTPAQVSDFGNQVCTAFDNGDTATHIKSVILNKVKGLPFTTILPGAADYVVKTAVKLYCPGYKSRLNT